MTMRATNDNKCKVQPKYRVIFLLYIIFMLMSVDICLYMCRYIFIC